MASAAETEPLLRRRRRKLKDEDNESVCGLTEDERRELAFLQQQALQWPARKRRLDAALVEKRETQRREWEAIKAVKWTAATLRASVEKKKRKLGLNQKGMVKIKEGKEEEKETEEEDGTPTRNLPPASPMATATEGGSLLRRRHREAEEEEDESPLEEDESAFGLRDEGNALAFLRQQALQWHAYEHNIVARMKKLDQNWREWEMMWAMQLDDPVTVGAWVEKRKREDLKLKEVADAKKGEGEEEEEEEEEGTAPSRNLDASQRQPEGD